jgi:hypothetical protein
MKISISIIVQKFGIVVQLKNKLRYNATQHVRNQIILLGQDNDLNDQNYNAQKSIDHNFIPHHQRGSYIWTDFLHLENVWHLFPHKYCRENGTSTDLVAIAQLVMSPAR